MVAPPGRRRVLAALAALAAAACDDRRAKRHRGRDDDRPERRFSLGDSPLLDKDVRYGVVGTDLVVVNRGRGMTIEKEGGHEVFCELEVEAGRERETLRLHGREARSFAGFSFVIAGIGEKHGGSDVKIRVTKAGAP